MTTLSTADTWFFDDLNKAGWNSMTIAGSLTEDVLTRAVEVYPQLPFAVKKGVLFSILTLKKGDFHSLKSHIQQYTQMAMEDPNDFIRSMARVLAPFPDSLDLDMDSWCEDFKSTLSNIGANIVAKGITFHSKEDMLLHPQARLVPACAATTYAKYAPTTDEPFNLKNDPNDDFSAVKRHARFAEMVAFDEKAERASASRNPPQRRPSMGSTLPSINTAAVHSRTGIRPQSPISPPNTMPHGQRPPMSSGQGPLPSPGHRPSMIMPGQRPPMPRRTSSGTNLAAQNSLFTKRPAKPIASNLFAPRRPAVPNRLNSLSSNLPKGLQREKRVAMLDFQDAAAMEQEASNAILKAKEDEKLELQAKKQIEQERKRQREEEEKQAIKEAKAKKAAAKKAKTKATTTKRRKQSSSEASSATDKPNTNSPTSSAPGSPQSATSTTPLSPSPRDGDSYPVSSVATPGNMLPSFQVMFKQEYNGDAPQQQPTQQRRASGGSQGTASPKVTKLTKF